MADHLVRRHPSPAALTPRLHSLQSQKELSLVALSSQGFHVASLCGCAPRAVMRLLSLAEQSFAPGLAERDERLRATAFGLRQQRLEGGVVP